MDGSFRRGTDHVGVQNADNHSVIHYQSRIYHPVHQPKGGHPNDGDAQGGRGTRGQDPRRAPKDPLHSL